MKTTKRIFKIGLGLFFVSVFVYIALIGYLLFVPKLKSYEGQTEFDSKIWQNHLTDKDTTKQIMVDHLLSKYQLVGMTQAKIDELLGKPPQTEYFKDYDYVYWLGPERSAFGIDSEWLCIKFEDGVVLRADILTD